MNRTKGACRGAVPCSEPMPCGRLYKVCNEKAQNAQNMLLAACCCRLLLLLHACLSSFLKLKNMLMVQRACARRDVLSNIEKQNILFPLLQSTTTHATIQRVRTSPAMQGANYAPVRPAPKTRHVTTTARTDWSRSGVVAPKASQTQIYMRKPGAISLRN